MVIITLEDSIISILYVKNLGIRKIYKNYSKFAAYHSTCLLFHSFSGSRFEQVVFLSGGSTGEKTFTLIILVVGRIWCFYLFRWEPGLFVSC
jgi:hypothetical protein